jgi:hypothetical protein
MKLRNAANSAWITLFQLDGEWSLIPFENGTAAAPSIYFKDSGTDTGIYSPGTDQVAITTGGTSRFEVSTTATTSTLPVVHPLGAVGTPSITFTGDLNTGFWSPAADTVAASTGGSERLRITSTGAVGIGNTSPGSYATGFNDLVVGNHTGNHGITIASQNTSTGRIMFADGTGASEVDVGEILYNHANNSLTISTNRFTALTVDSSQRLLVGTSSGSLDFQLKTSGGFQAVSASEIALRYNAYYDGADKYIQAANKASSLVMNSNGEFLFYNTNTASTSAGSNITGWTERMRIRSGTTGGLILVGRSASVSANATLGIDTASGVAGIVSETGPTSSIDHIRFYNGNGNVGNITTNGSATAYGTSSDYRLKENITAIDDGITRLQQLKPSRFNFIADPDTTVDGFIAHEAQVAVPECVIGDKDAVDEDGTPIYQGIDQSKLVPLLTAALQEAIARIVTLEAKVAALEAS